MATPAAAVLRPPTTVAIALIRRLLTTTTVPLGATTLLPIGAIPRRAATMRLRTEAIRRRVPFQAFRLIPLRAVAVPRRVATLHPAPPEAGSVVADHAAAAAASTVVAVAADPTAEAVGGHAAEAVVAAVPTPAEVAVPMVVAAITKSSTL